MNTRILSGKYVEKSAFTARSNTHYISDALNPAVYEKHWLEAPNQHDIVFEGITFTSNSGQILSSGLHHVTFLNCSFLYLNPVNEIFCLLKPGNDFWTFDGCRFWFCGDAIYTKQENGYGASFLTVKNCFFENIGTTPEHPSRDGHCIGWQNNRPGDSKNPYSIVIEDNTCYNVGTGICGWTTAGRPLQDIWVVGNSLYGCRDLGNENGSGIKFTGNTQPLGLRKNIIVRDNIIDSCDGYGISNNSPFKIKDDGNKIINCKLGNIRQL